ncbi:MAG: hypothetical protein O3B24_01700 [Verrucomicrobia bacterium]|nr:hypothetical protein [Verrucomicrobiota bacterium]
MKPGAYFITLLLGSACLAVSVGLVFVIRSNQRAQGKLQAKQESLSNSVLGPRAQQISSSVLQDMANAAAKNPEMQALLVKHGFQVNAPKSPAAAALEDSEAEEESGSK